MSPAIVNNTTEYEAVPNHVELYPTHCPQNRESAHSMSSSRERLRDKARASFLSQNGVRLASVSHAVREKQSVSRRKHVVHQRSHGRLVRFLLPGGWAEDARKAKILRLQGRRNVFPRERKAKMIIDEECASREEQRRAMMENA